MNKNSFLLYSFLFIFFLVIGYFLMQEIPNANHKTIPIVSLCLGLLSYIILAKYLIDIWNYYVFKRSQTFIFKDGDIAYKQDNKSIKQAKIAKILRDVLYRIFPAICIAILSMRMDIHGGFVTASCLFIYCIAPQNLLFNIYLIKPHNTRKDLGGVYIYHPFLQCGFFEYGNCLIFREATWQTVFGLDEDEYSIATLDNFAYDKKGNIVCLVTLSFSLHAFLDEREFLKIYTKNTTAALLQTDIESFQTFKTMFLSLERKIFGRLIGKYNPLGYDGTIDPYINLKWIEQQRKENNGESQ
ncbi:hypothetical protein CQA53_10995 [Helicobacter didelphidarum]|uniref:Uncharacterized protein n=2 Tax=Helicobacter didelphidarum TaxID=2040648 RepID=A0A3D8I6Q5_9HELI|nr:hypothetical protein CQA53_10995 [Helicobacter didelphidarum]